MANHYPLPIRGKLLPAHAKPGDTANHLKRINCTACRNMLEAKVAAHTREASHYKPGSSQHKFFSDDAEAWKRVLSQ